MTVLSTAWDCVVEGFFMFWETLWALILGFTLSGMVQSFVSRAEMERVMGDHRPRTIVRTSLIGAASSSCSYAASALARSLFRRGADFTTAMVFMFASTNLVLELGIVLWLLMGWQFAAAELVGGVIMVALLVLLAPRVFPARLVEQARQHAGAGGPGGGHDGHGDAPDDERPLRERLRSRAGWADAAGYAVSDVTMLRRELLLGYLLAGILAVAVPASVYSAVFVSGHGLLTDVENVVVGPFIAFISFVCSVGNVPLAAALYEGGISFGGTVAFVFADLIALPLVLIYAKFYGRRIAVRLFFTFWLVMGVAGLAVDLLFRAVGIAAPDRRAEIAPTGFTWNYTTWLNIVFLVVAAVVYVTYRNRERLGGGQGYAKDPVCGMQVEQANPGATAEHEGRTVYFCSDRCRDRFLADPERYLTSPDAESTGDRSAAAATDPVCGMEVDSEHPGAQAEHDGHPVFFCSPGCRDQFLADPERYAASTHGSDDVDLRGEGQHQGYQR
ncbi:MAG TPA: permease [Marmoricola sp.]|nr:permease [Marmoricola sp.]